MRDTFVEMYTDSFTWLFLPSFLTGILVGTLAMITSAFVGAILSIRARGGELSKFMEEVPAPGQPPRVLEMVAFFAVVAIPMFAATTLPTGYRGNAAAGVFMGVMVSTFVPSAAQIVVRWRTRPKK